MGTILAMMWKPYYDSYWKASSAVQKVHIKAVKSSYKKKHYEKTELLL